MSDNSLSLSLPLPSFLLFPTPFPTESARLTRDTNKVHSSKVYAFDKDPRRLALMRKRVNEAGGAGAIDTRLQDFFEVDPADPRYSKVTAILLDPSCSGSGIVSAPERLHDGSHDENDDDGGQGAARVKKLAEFQLSGLLKAMSFPQVCVCVRVLRCSVLVLVDLCLLLVCIMMSEGMFACVCVRSHVKSLFNFLNPYPSSKPGATRVLLHLLHPCRGERRRGDERLTTATTTITASQQ